MLSRLILLVVTVLVLLASVCVEARRAAKTGGGLGKKAKGSAKKGKKGSKKTSKSSPVSASSAADENGALLEENAVSNANDADNTAAAVGESEPSKAFRNNVEKYMPDPDEPKVAQNLRCTSCAAIVQELHSRMTRANQRAIAQGKKGGAAEYEFVDIFDETCKNISSEWGLKVVGDTIEPQYVPKTAAKYHIRSGWVASMIRDRCAEITDTYDQQLYKLGRGKKDVQEWAEFICVVMEKSCSAVVDQPSADAAVPADDTDL